MQGQSERERVGVGAAEQCGSRPWAEEPVCVYGVRKRPKMGTSSALSCQKQAGVVLQCWPLMSSSAGLSTAPPGPSVPTFPVGITEPRVTEQLRGPRGDLAAERGSRERGYCLKSQAFSTACRVGGGGEDLAGLQDEMLIFPMG